MMWLIVTLESYTCNDMDEFSVHLRCCLLALYVQFDAVFVR
ncbi:hypothetical protein [Nitrosospira briensis]|nr:hypothetical protein [Nitrosospira briensis]SFN68719.1 hypothetical protein SAMN05216332_101200 [Nitrosospira briensis]